MNHAVELRQLRYVEAVARHRHFTRAAEELHVAQSALSHQVRKLEAELGTELFERTSRSVAPTEAGEAVAARARRVLAEVDGVRDEVDELQGLVRGRISIGALLPAGEIDVPRLLAGFAAPIPGIEVGLREGTAGDMARYSRRTRSTPRSRCSPASRPKASSPSSLSEDELVAVFPPGGAPRRGPVSAADLAAQPVAIPRGGLGDQPALDEFFADAGEPMTSRWRAATRSCSAASSRSASAPASSPAR